LPGWKIPPAARRKRTLNPTEIVQAAARVLQRDGYEALTIRAVADELGVKSASLYWHFETKEALEDLLADELLAGVAFDAITDDWRADLRNGSLRFVRHLLSRRDAGRVLAGRLVAGPNTLRWMEAGLGPFRRAGLSDRDAAFASHAVHIYMIGFVIFQGSDLSSESRAGKSRQEILDQTRRLFRDLPAAEYPNLTALADGLTIPDREGRFLFGLDRLIAGIADLTGSSPS
jgi:TetR/AcrR family transcriptional regulator, tetracycline repressor protein